MPYRIIKGTSDVLQRANSFRRTSWKWWWYTKQTDLLIIGIYEVAFLVFHRPSYFCLTGTLKSPYFRLNEDIPNHGHNWNVDPGTEPLNVQILDDDRIFNVVCQKITIHVNESL